MSDIIVIQPVTPNITVEPIIPVVEITAPGPQGQAGQFTPGDVAYTHTQSVASSVWTINHNLNFKPVAVVLDSAGTNCEGSFSYPNNVTMVITFNSAFTGTAYLV